MDLTNMTLVSPNYPKYYFADNTVCEWLLTAPEGNIIALEFNHFDVSTNIYICVFETESRALARIELLIMSIGVIIYGYNEF